MLVDSVAKLHLLRYPATLLVGFTLRSNNYIVSGFTSVCNLAKRYLRTLVGYAIFKAWGNTPNK